MFKHSATETGIRYGLIGGFVYVLLSYLQYTFTPENPLRFFVYKLLTYSVIVVLYVMAARERRRNLGGHASFRSLVQVLVITITITVAIAITVSARLTVAISGRLAFARFVGTAHAAAPQRLHELEEIDRKSVV